MYLDKQPTESLLADQDIASIENPPTKDLYYDLITKHFKYEDQLKLLRSERKD